MLIDTHSHLNFNAYKNDLDKVISRTLDNNIWMINVGSKYETSKKAVEIAEKYKQGVFASVGLHPIYSATEFIKVRTDPDEGDFKVREESFDKKKYKELAISEKVVAVGEIGLDYYYKPKTNIKLEQFKAKQKEVFRQQLELAQELNLPVILHCRMAHDDLINIISNFQFSISNKFPISNLQLRGVIHCFTGTWEEAKKYIEMGFYLGINGIIFKFNIDEVIKKTPLDKILVETDCPYLIPPLARRSPEGEGGRNEPIFIKHVVQKIADLKACLPAGRELTFQEVADKTTENARKLFKI